MPFVRGVTALRKEKCAVSSSSDCSVQNLLCVKTALCKCVLTRKFLAAVHGVELEAAYPVGPAKDTISRDISCGLRRG